MWHFPDNWSHDHLPGDRSHDHLPGDWSHDRLPGDWSHGLVCHLTGYHIWTVTIYGTSNLGHAPFGKLTLLGLLTIYGNTIFGSRPYMVAASFGQVYIIHSSFVTGPNHIRVVPSWTVSTGLSISILIPYTLSVNLPDFPHLGKFIFPLVGQYGIVTG